MFDLLGHILSLGGGATHIGGTGMCHLRDPFKTYTFVPSDPHFKLTSELSKDHILFSIKN